MIWSKNKTGGHQKAATAMFWEHGMPEQRWYDNVMYYLYREDNIIAWPPKDHTIIQTSKHVQLATHDDRQWQVAQQWQQTRMMQLIDIMIVPWWMLTQLFELLNH